LSPEELKDFRVPYQAFKDHVQCLRKSKSYIKDCILRAIGVQVEDRNAKVDWEQFLHLHKVINLHCRDKAA